MSLPMNFAALAALLEAIGNAINDPFVSFVFLDDGSGHFQDINDRVVFFFHADNMNDLYHAACRWFFSDVL